MANNSTISIGFKLEDASGGFKKLIMDAESFRKAIDRKSTRLNSSH